MIAVERTKQLSGPVLAALVCCLLLTSPGLQGPARGEEPAAPPRALPAATLAETETETAEPETWKFTLGAGLGIEPAYEGSDEIDFEPVPLVMISWRDTVVLGPEGLTVNSPRFGPISGALSLGYNGGRDEDDSDDLEGLGDIGPAAQIGLDVALALGELGPVAASLDVGARQDIGGSYGLTVAAGPTLTYEVSPELGFELAAAAVWADGRHMEDYFGVSSSQASASGLNTFDADAGVKRVDLTLGVKWQAFEHWTVIGEVGVGRLVGDAEDSPITKEELQPSVFFGVGYSF